MRYAVALMFLVFYCAERAYVNKLMGKKVWGYLASNAVFCVTFSLKKVIISGSMILDII